MPTYVVYYYTCFVTAASNKIICLILIKCNYAVVIFPNLQRKPDCKLNKKKQQDLKRRGLNES